MKKKIDLIVDRRPAGVLVKPKSKRGESFIDNFLDVIPNRRTPYDFKTGEFGFREKYVDRFFIELFHKGMTVHMIKT